MWIRLQRTRFFWHLFYKSRETSTPWVTSGLYGQCPLCSGQFGRGLIDRISSFSKNFLTNRSVAFIRIVVVITGKDLKFGATKTVFLNRDSLLGSELSPSVFKCFKGWFKRLLVPGVILISLKSIIAFTIDPSFFSTGDVFGVERLQPFICLSLLRFNWNPYSVWWRNRKRTHLQELFELFRLSLYSCLSQFFD